MIIQRRKTVPVRIGDVVVGGDAPIVVQSMTNTDTADAIRTTAQCAELAQAGSEIVRITVNTEEAARAVLDIVNRLEAMNTPVPLVGDFHFNGHKLLSKYPECAEALAKYRINPGNVGRGKRRDEQFAQMIELACQYNKPVRIGVSLWFGPKCVLNRPIHTWAMFLRMVQRQPDCATALTRPHCASSLLSRWKPKGMENF